MRSNGNERPTVGIVTRTKNRSVLLRRAIESVIHQTYPDWRMVIVNDGGDPGETEFLAGHYAEAAAGRIRIIHNPKSLGMEGASKVGLEAIDSDLLILHDDDDSWSPEFLSVAVNELQHMQKKFPSTQGVTTYSHVVWETVRGNLVEILSCEPFNEWVPPGFLSLDRMLAGNLPGRLGFSGSTPLSIRRLHDSAIPGLLSLAAGIGTGRPQQYRNGGDRPAPVLPPTAVERLAARRLCFRQVWGGHVCEPADAPRDPDHSAIR